MKPVLVGESNPYSDDPDDALLPYPEQSAGARLCRMMEIEQAQYLRTFARRNLLEEGPWRIVHARAAAVEIQRDFPASDLILLGSRVFQAFFTQPKILGDRFVAPTPRSVPVTFANFAWKSIPRGYLVMGHVVTYGNRIIVLPHPSGLSRAWNDPEAPARLRSLLQRYLSKEDDDG